MFSILIQAGCCGFGLSIKPPVELRLGLVSVTVCRGHVVAGLQKLKDQLQAALQELRRKP